MDKDDRALLRELIRIAEQQEIVEDVYSVGNIEDSADDDFMNAAEHGFMSGFIA
jgi:hypothetical protein